VTVANVSLKDIHKILPKLTTAEQEQLLAELDKLDKLKTRALSRKRFLKFVEEVWPSFIAGRHHAKMADAFERVARGELKRLIINMPPRHRLDIREQIPTTQGWKTVETVEVGDYVFAPDGAPVQVTGKSAEYDEEIYEVTTSDGQVVRCDATHLWTVRFGSNDRPYQTLSTQEILHKLETESWRRTGNLPILPPQGAAEYPHKDNLPLTPYMLGVWLGDGSSYDATVGCGYSDQSAMRAQVEAEGYKTTHNPKYQQFNVLGLYKPLREQGFLRNKHIPEAYLCASIPQRMALLQGLIDTDGDVTEEGKVTFNNSNERLIDDVLCLLHGLGVQARKTRRQTGYKGKPSQPSFRVMFKLANAARLPRKAVRCRDKQGNWGRSIDIRKTAERGTVQCLEVANEDGLFMAGRGWVVTHNTKSEFASYLLPAWFLGLNPGKKIIQCSHTGELAVGFGRKVRNLVDTEVYHETFPDLKLAADSKAAGRWNTSKGGDYFAIGVGGAVTGKGADVLIIDDPHALEVSTLIPTMKGFVELQDLAVGDFVFGPDGEPTKVVAKSAVYHERQLYAVETYDGATIYADAEHLWRIRTSTRVTDPYQNVPTRELLTKRSSAFMIPRHSAVQYEVANLPVDPWVLGAWLGDGTSSLGRMTAHPDDAIFMRGEYKRRGYETTDLTDKFSFGVKGLRAELIALGVLDNKHIPQAYLTASFHQRMDLLCGLIDTDGNVTIGGQCVFHNKDVALVDQVVELLHSLGRKCRRRSYHTKGKFGACLMHRVTFKLKDCALMPRKRHRTKTTHDKQHRSIVVTDTGRTGSVQCITVEREDGLFLAGRGYVVTHNSEQEAAIAEINPDIYDKTYEWYTSGPRQRLQPGGAIVVVMTRWSKRDLTGQILKDAAANGSLDEWEVIEFPAILPSGNPLWPEFWDLDELEKVKRDVPNSKWMAQYQQNPVSESAAIVKREWWQEWPHDEPPNCDFILQSWDTAFEKTSRADYSACTTWGVFYQPDDNGTTQANIILLNAFRDRMEFPELKRAAIEEYKEWQPDGIIIEKKASGAPLIYEMRAMGIPVQEFTPTRGNDKISRLNGVADIFASGRVWAPATRWAEEVIDEVADFPAGQNDDYVDTVSMAMHRFRRGGYVTTNLDEPEDIMYFKSHKHQGYY